MLRTLWLIARHDAGTVLRQRSFWLFSFIMPAILLSYFTYSAVRDAGPAPAEATPAAAPAQAAPGLPAIGLVDTAGLIRQMPPGLPADWLTRFPDEAAARAALAAGQIEQIVVIPADYLRTGQVTVYDRDFQLLSSGADMGVAYGSAQAWVLETLINYNLTGDAQLLAQLRNPTPGSLATQHRLNPQPPAAASPAADWISTVVPFAFYFLLVLSGSYLLRSVVAEKENRTAEALLLSLPPRDLMLGKILAISAVLGVQLIIWAGGALLTLDRAAGWLPPAGLVFPPGFWAWAALFLVLGYLLFAAVMAAAGALAPNAREGGQVIWLLILPLMPTMMFGEEITAQPDAALTLILSLFPFSAPSAMVTRLAVGPVPLWQIGLSVTGLLLTTWLGIVWAGRFFRAEHLLSFAPFNWRRLFTRPAVPTPES